MTSKRGNAPKAIRDEIYRKAILDFQKQYAKAVSQLDELATAAHWLGCVKPKGKGK